MSESDQEIWSEKQSNRSLLLTARQKKRDKEIIKTERQGLECTDRWAATLIFGAPLLILSKPANTLSVDAY